MSLDSQRNCCPARTAEPDELRHAGVDRVVEKVLQFTPEPGRKPARRMRGFDLAFGIDRRVGAASRWSTSSTLRWDSPSSRKQPDRGRARCGPGLRRLRAARSPAGGARRRAVRSVPSSSPRRARGRCRHVPGWPPSSRRPVHRDHVGELEPAPADVPREPVGVLEDPHRARCLRGAHAGNTVTSRTTFCSAHASVIRPAGYARGNDGLAGTDVVMSQQDTPSPGSCRAASGSMARGSCSAPVGLAFCSVQGHRGTGRALRVDEVTVDAGTAVREAIDEAVLPCRHLDWLGRAAAATLRSPSAPAAVTRRRAVAPGRRVGQPDVCSGLQNY